MSKSQQWAGLCLWRYPGFGFFLLSLLHCELPPRLVSGERRVRVTLRLLAFGFLILFLFSFLSPLDASVQLILIPTPKVTHFEFLRQLQFPLYRWHFG